MCAIGWLGRLENMNDDEDEDVFRNDGEKGELCSSSYRRRDFRRSVWLRLVFKRQSRDASLTRMNASTRADRSRIFVSSTIVPEYCPGSRFLLLPGGENLAKLPATTVRNRFRFVFAPKQPVYCEVWPLHMPITGLLFKSDQISIQGEQNTPIKSYIPLIYEFSRTETGRSNRRAA